MSGKAAFSLRGRNPDVLTCIANLSNDEVFTPPALANQVLDSLGDAWARDHDGATIWRDPTVRFLDPVTKSGVFLREITSRLTEGLREHIPDLQERVDHIVTNQVFGIAITQLTSLLARRSVYCSKRAGGTHSISKRFSTDWGNIWFEPLKHTWDDQKCVYCGASRKLFDRKGNLETHAYALIHSDDVRASVAEMFGGEMQFDVIVGNPPYQIAADEAGQNVLPIYNLFVERAKQLNPRYITMVTPSRWMAGGKYLDEFRATMLNDRRIEVIVDFPNAAEMFPAVGINGGVSYFLWNAEHDGKCAVTVMRAGNSSGPHLRDLNEFDVFVRDDRAVAILHKVLAKKESSFSELVSPRDPFGPALSSNFSDYRMEKKAGDLRLHVNIGTKRETAWVSQDYVTKSKHLVQSWKVLVPKAGSGREREKSGVDLVLGPPLIASPGSVCTLTYVVVGPLDSQAAAESVECYLKTRFLRFLVSLRKISQDAPRGVYAFVPQQTWDRKWTDDMLFEKYGVTEEEVKFIESIIRPMRESDD